MLRIDEILKQKGISNLDFAEMMGVSPTSASAFKSGRTKPKFDTLVKMSEVLDVDIRELFKSKRGSTQPYGFIEYDDQVHKIESFEDIVRFLGNNNG